MTSALRRVPPLFVFLTAALTVYTVELFVVRSASFWARPSVLGPAVAIDLAVFVPALYWLLVMRRGRGSWLGFFAVLTLAWLVAPLVLPPPQRHYLSALLLLGPLAEVVSLAYAAGRVRRVARAYRAWPGDPADVLARLRHAVAVGLGPQRAWTALADELAMWRYAIVPPPLMPAPPGVFSYNRRSAWGGVVLAIALAACVETLAVHLLVALWLPRLAWVLTFSSVYAVIWLIADLRACARRPIVLGDALLVRVGIRWTVRVRLSAIERVTPVRGTAVPPRRAPAYLRATPFGPPSLLLELRDEVVAEGPYGLRRPVRRLGLSPDDPAAFTEALQRRLHP
ncbi:MAG TPA: hypothetical protein VF832_08170 [Longimicrobiales bacterium]